MHHTEARVRDSLATFFVLLAMTETTDEALEIADLVKPLIEGFSDLQTLARVRAMALIDKE